MKTTISDLIKLIQVPKEGANLEFKLAQNAFDLHKLLQYCVALGNEGGGQVILGVTDQPPRQIIGSAAFPDLSEGCEPLD